jgi:CDP-diacylglycerol---serine O-phosphatidyltransferase
MRLTRSIVPNLLTLLNVFMGFNSIIFASSGEYFKAGLCVLLAAVFDMLDGIVARMLKASSELGAQLDSLCDAVSFGVAPSFILYKMYFCQQGEIGILIASLPALCGVTRLARFNIQMSGFEDKLYFTGLPIPAGALTILSYVLLFKDSGYIPVFYNDFMFFMVSMLTAFVMISTIKFDNMPRPTFKYIKKKPIVFSIFVIGVLSCIFTKGMMIFPFMVFYIVVSSIRHFVIWFKSNISAEDEFDETENLDRQDYN